MVIEVDTNLDQMRSYKLYGQIVEKSIYNWHCIPIITSINFSSDTKYKFEV